jgi:hypothetical protein
LPLEIGDESRGLLNNCVNEPAGSLPATPASGGGSAVRGALNMAVNSPTDFRGGSIGGDGVPGVSEGPCTRNGPWKKFVNSPGLGLLLATGEFVSDGTFGVSNAKLNGLSELPLFGSAFAGERGEVIASQFGAG